MVIEITDVSTTSGTDRAGDPPQEPDPPPADPPGTVSDLSVLSVTETSVTLSFTEVENGLGSPASNDIRYMAPPMSWGGATVVTQGTCTSPQSGVAIGATLTCVVEGLDPNTEYDFRLVSFRGTLNLDAIFGGLSNITTATTTSGIPLAISTLSVSQGVVDVAYSQTLEAEGGDGSYTWALINGTTLATGLSLNSSTGEISGTPTTEETVSFDVEVTSDEQTATKTLQIIVNAASELTVSALSRDVGSTAGGSVLKISGTGFEAGSVASFGGVNATSTVLNSTTLLTVTVPAHVVGLVDVTVTLLDAQSATLQDSGGYGFEYLPAPSVTYISHDFEDGTLGDFTTGFAAPTVAEWGVGANSGTFAVKAKKWSGSDGGSKLVYDRSGLSPSNPPLESTGVYQRWYQYIAQDIIDAIDAGDIDQIKILLNRGGPGAWLQGIVGRQAGNQDSEVVMWQDANTGVLPPSTGFVVKADSAAANSASRTGFLIPADEWVEFQTWFYHDGTKGRAKLWINGKEMFDVLGGTGTRGGGPCTSADSPEGCLGTSDGSGEYDWELGVVWVQGNRSGVDAAVYLDDVAMADGYIEPV